MYVVVKPYFYSFTFSWMTLTFVDANFEARLPFKLIEAKWCIFASMNKANFGFDNGLLLVQCPAIIWTNPGLLLIKPLETN